MAGTTNVRVLARAYGKSSLSDTRICALGRRHEIRTQTLFFHFHDKMDSVSMNPAPILLYTVQLRLHNPVILSTTSTTCSIYLQESARAYSFVTSWTANFVHQAPCLLSRMVILIVVAR